MNPGRALSEQHGQRTQAPNDIEFGVGSRSLAAEYLFAHDECPAQAGKLGRGHVETAEKMSAIPLPGMPQRLKSARCHREVARGGLHSVGLDARIALSEIEMRPALSEAPAHSLKAAARLLKHPLHDSRIVVTESQIVIQRRETMRLARLLHFIQL